MTHALPPSFSRVVGDLPELGVLPTEHHRPFETIGPASEGFVERDGVRIAYAVWGRAGPWLVFAPPFQFAHSRYYRANVPYLARHYRVVTLDGRGNGRSDRPRGQAAYLFEPSYRDFVAVLDHIGADCIALIAMSAAALTGLRFAGEYPAACRTSSCHAAWPTCGSTTKPTCAWSRQASRACEAIGRGISTSSCGNVCRSRIPRSTSRTVSGTRGRPRRRYSSGAGVVGWAAT